MSSQEIPDDAKADSRRSNGRTAGLFRVVMAVSDRGIGKEIARCLAGEFHLEDLSSSPENIPSTAEDGAFDAILLDAEAARLHGASTLERHKAARTPVILVDALEEKEALEFEGVVDDFLRVPINEAEARARVRSHARLGSSFRKSRERERRALGEAEKLEEKPSESELERRFNHLREFVETAAIGLHWAGPDEKIVWANQAELEMLGYRREEFVGRSVRDFHVDPDVVESIFARLKRGERVTNQAARLRCKDGSIRVVSVDSSVLWEEGEFIHTQCLIRDVTEQRMLEDERARLAAIIQDSDDAIISKDLDGLVRSWNPAAERIFGYSSNEMIGQSIKRIIPPRLHSEEDEMMGQIRKGERINHFDSERLAKDGRRIRVSLSISPVRGGRGAVVGASTIARDVSKEAETAEAIRQSEHRLRALMDAAPAAIWIAVGPDCAEISGNAAAAALLGVSPEANMAFNPSREYPSGLYEIQRDGRALSYEDLPMRTVARTGRPAPRQELEFRFANAPSKWAYGNAVPLFDAEGRLEGVISVFVDITERKRAEAALRESEERLRLATQTGKVGVWDWEIDAGRVTWTDSLHGIYGIDREQFDATPQGFLALVHPDDREAMKTAIDRALKGESSYELEFRALRPDGRVIWLFTHAVVLREEGRARRMIGATLEITQRKLEEEKLESLVAERTRSLSEAVAQMEEFSYTVSHDLRAPLRAMNAYSEALLEDYGSQLDATAQDYLARIQRSSRRMENLTHDVLEYSRLARTDQKPSPVNVDQLIRDIVAQHREFQGARPSIEVAGPIPPVLGLEGPLAQALTNLLVNAIKFVRPGQQPWVRFSGERIGSRVRIWVEDNGIGIKPEERSRLFRMFERLHGADKYEGTGIGLAIVRKAVEKMWGRCGVESDGIHGSRFWIELPGAK